MPNIDTTPEALRLNPSPKAKFQALNTNISRHRQLVDRPEFEYAAQSALLEYQRILCEQRGDMSQAAANHMKLCGAQEFLHVFWNLSESHQFSPTEKMKNLKHDV